MKVLITILITLYVPAVASAYRLGESSELSLTAVRGKNTIVLHWATWRPGSVAALEQFIALAHDFEVLGKEFAFVAVNCDRSVGDARKFASRNARPRNLKMAWNPKCGEKELPTPMLIRKDGTVLAKIADTTDWSDDEEVELIRSRFRLDAGELNPR